MGQNVPGPHRRYTPPPKVQAPLKFTKSSALGKYTTSKFYSLPYFQGGLYPANYNWPNDLVKKLMEYFM